MQLPAEHQNDGCQSDAERQAFYVRRRVKELPAFAWGHWTIRARLPMQPASRTRAGMGLRAAANSAEGKKIRAEVSIRTARSRSVKLSARTSHAVAVEIGVKRSLQGQAVGSMGGKRP